MQQYTFDLSHALKLALIANEDLSAAHYAPITEAPSEQKALAKPYLLQLHAVANSVACGLTVRTRMQLKSNQWSGLR
ncbi:MAG: hypothetical protein WKF61_08680 [Luteimonas sp.]